MAVILVLACGMFGFVSAITSYLAFDATLLQAVVIWSAFGLAAAMVCIAVAMTPEMDHPREGHRI